MTSSVRYSQIALRLGLAAVFLWLGIDAFIHSASRLAYLTGVFEVLAGVSFVTGVFMRLFALLAAAFLVVVAFVLGLTEITVRDVGLIGGLVALAIWSERI